MELESIMITQFISFAVCLSMTSSLDLITDSYEHTVKAHACRSWCVARCLTEGNVTIEGCSVKCTEYNSTNLCSDSSCWAICRDMGNSIASGSEPLVKGLRGSHDHNDLRVISLNWEKQPGAKLYFIVFKDTNNTDGSWQPVNELIIDAEYQFVKPEFCLSYSFKVAAVSASGVGPFSPVEEIIRPDLNISQSQVALKLISLANISTAVEAKIYYDLGTAWKPDYIALEKTNVILLSIKAPNIMMPIPKLSLNDTYIEILFPLSVIDSNAIFDVSISSISSVCGDSVFFKFKIEDSLVLNLNCDTVDNSGCTEYPAPCFLHNHCLHPSQMNITWTQPHMDKEGSASCNSSSALISWEPLVKKDIRSKICSPIKYQIQYGLADPTPGIFRDMLVPKTANSLELPGTETRYELANLTLNDLYFSVCAVFISDPRIPEIDWKINPKKRTMGTDVKKMCLKSAEIWVIVVTVLTAVVLLSTIITAVTVMQVKKSRRQRREMVGITPKKMSGSSKIIVA